MTSLNYGWFSKMRVRKPNLLALAKSIIALGASSLGSAAPLGATPALPIPCAAGACRAGPGQFVTAGAASASTTSNTLTINQTSNSAILNWSTFNIGAGGSVVFKQPNASAIALNRIFQASPSQIFGNLSANGQIYLLNMNGFLFGSTATVNVGSLLVSSLPLSLTDAQFGKGILSPLQDQKAVFDQALDPQAAGGRTGILDANDNLVLDAAGHPVKVQVVVEPGAKLTAADQGRLLLTGQQVINSGSLVAPDGQIILAAGTKVYLQADSDPALRGLIVEVDGNALGGASAPSFAANMAGGYLSAARGNVTMVGLAVNQNGRISATTSVSANGSIRLEAAGKAVFNNVAPNVVVSSTQGGRLTVGPQSVMDILPELASTATAVADQQQYGSTVTLLGEQVFLQGGTITAPGGTLNAIAAASPSSAATHPDNSSSIQGVAGRDPNARLRIDSGTTIDLAGSFAELPASANLVSAQLRASEFANDPTQRNGALRGQTVYVNARLGSPLIADLKGEISAVPQTIAQRTLKGGNAIFQSEGDAVFASGASVNVSGGSTTYDGGVLQTSYLVGSNGQLYPIATANPLLTYVGVVNPTFSQTFNKWGVQDVLPTAGLSSYQPGYVQGAAAGSVQFVAPNMVLQGSLKGNAINGLYQRTPSTVVSGGQFTIGLPAGLGSTSTSPAVDYLSPAVQLLNAPYPIAVADESALPEGLSLTLPTRYLTSNGFTSTRIFSNSTVTLSSGTPLVLPAGSTLAVNAARVNLYSGITDPGGTLSFQNVGTVADQQPTPDRLTNDRPGVYLSDGLVFDVRGQWTNDLHALVSNSPASTQTWQNGGTVNLGVASESALLSIGNNDSLRANGGAWLNAKGSLSSGKGGSIALNENALKNGGISVGSNFAVEGYGVNGATGGTFSLSAPRIAIDAGGAAMAQSVDDTVAPGGIFHVDTGLFSNFGFQNVLLNASGLSSPGSSPGVPNANALAVNGAVSAVVNSLVLDSHISLDPSAATVSNIATVKLLPEYLRPAANVNLSALPPINGFVSITAGVAPVADISVGSNASITVDAGGMISLTGLDSILVDGKLTAPGGTVALHILAPTYSPDNGKTSYAGYDAGFLVNQRIELEPNAIIDASGTFVPKFSNLGLDLGAVYAGGSISLYADRGYVATDLGSLISVAGGNGHPVDILQASGNYGHVIAATSGGSVSTRSGEAISLLGDLQAAAGFGGTSGTAVGGSLDVELTRSQSWGSGLSGPGFGQSPLTIQLAQSNGATAPLPADSNLSILSADSLANSGIAALRMEAGDEVQLSGNVSLNLARGLVIDAPAIGATSGTHANLNAAYIQVGYEPAVQSGAPIQASAGTGAVTFSTAQSGPRGEIDLVGSTAFQGISDLSFVSAGDIVLRGSANAPTVGSLTSAGNLTLDAARIYPVTSTRFTINVGNPSLGVAGNVVIGSSAGAPIPAAPLSAGGALVINTDTLASDGTLFAPFGSISLNANKSLILGAGSLTSVSGNGLIIPYGQTQFGGQQWTDGATHLISGIPKRTVNLNAPAISLTKGATVDLSGGGDLLAYEFSPGTGGSTDALAAGVKPGLYAILPSLTNQAAPQDPRNIDPSIQAGETLYLSGGGGVASGTYTLLPARYALLPGAYLIQYEPQYQSVKPGSLGSLADGTPVIGGYLSYGSSGVHQSPGYAGFAIYPGSYGGSLAQYGTSLASHYFSAAAVSSGAKRPNLPADAGSLSINLSSIAGVLNTLDINDGLVRTAAAAGGLAAPIEISANNLVVGTPSGAVAADAVSLSAAVLEGWQPGSLLLGGTTDASSGNVIVGATSVTVGSGSLTADQIILVAAQSIDVQNGAVLDSTSGASGKAPVSLPTQQTVTLAGAGSGSAAFLAVSDVNWLIPNRSGVPAAGIGNVQVDTGASVGSRGSVSVDGPGSVAINGLIAGAGAAWSLGSSSIGFTSASTSTGKSDALLINADLLSSLNAAGAVRIASTGSIDIAAPVRLGVDLNGGQSLKALTMAATNLNSSGNDVVLGAQTLVLQGASSKPVGAPIVGTATLTLTANELDLGPNAINVSGFANTYANVAGAVIGKGVGALNVGGNFTIATAGVTAAAAAKTSLNASGALVIRPLDSGTSASSASAVPVLLGGELDISGASLDIVGKVTAPSGIVRLATLSGDLNVDSGAVISTAGSVVTVGNQVVSSPGGNIFVDSANNLTLSSGSLLDVSGAGLASAGGMSLSAPIGTTSVAATLRGSGAGAGGSFVLNTNQFLATGINANPLTSLAASVSDFGRMIDLRVHNGDWVLDAGSSLTANSITLTADTGSLRVGGDISAPSAALRGNVSLFAGNVVELRQGGQIHADGTGASGIGGKIEMGTGTSINLDAGGVISASGAAGMGSLLLRAPALVASNDVAIQSASDMHALGQVVVEPVLSFNTSTLSSASAPSSADFLSIQAAVQSYMTLARTNIANRFASGVPLVVEPGVEIVAPGNLTLPGLDLSSAGLKWQFNGAPVDLTIRAVGNIEVAGSISDGFGTASIGKGGGSQSILLAEPSGSIRLIAGADLSSANPLAIVAPNTSPLVGSLTGGNLVLDPGVMVRTGTGDLNLVASNNIVMGLGASAYTAGVPAVAPALSSANLIPAKLGIVETATAANGQDYVYGVLIPKTSLLMSFPTGGGNLWVRAGQDVVGPQDSSGNWVSVGGVPTWQLREGGGTYGNSLPIPAEWGVNLAAYNWNFGTLGGGDVSISAGRDALNVSAAAANSLLPQQGGNAPQYVIGGGFSLQAGNNIGSTQVFVANGTGTVRAQGALTAILNPLLNAPPSPNDPLVGSVFYLQSSSINVLARLGIAFDGAYNPTALGQPAASTITGNANPLANSFFSYGSDSALSLNTIGDVMIGTAPTAARTLLGTSVSDAGGVGTDVLPPSLLVESLSGSISFGSGLGSSGAATLYPASSGQLALIAAKDITAVNSEKLTMSDAAGGFNTVATPSIVNVGGSIESAAFSGNIHALDTHPALAIAGGSINGLTLSLPKAGQVLAGGDIVNLSYAGQNLNANDQTILSAGHDFVNLDNYAGGGISVGGPGQLDVLAGRNLALGQSSVGIVTTGNLFNPNLATASGADLTVATGLGTTPDFHGFLNNIIANSAPFKAELVSYVESLNAGKSPNTSAGLSFADATTAFSALSVDQQRPLIDQVFFQALLASGRAANSTPGVGFSDGYKAIDVLFPHSRPDTSGAIAGAYAGDLTLNFSRIYTLSGGNINLVVPGGLVNVGLANPPPTLTNRLPSQLGIVAEGPGDVNIYTQGDVNVSSSRIFTLGGGNILIWSNNGSIDAGKGAKTAVSAPPPSVLINSDGTTTINFSGAAAGSGIRTIQTDPNQPLGNVDLIAPVGSVNAGDAGIGSAGNINIAARQVFGLDNIQFGGTSAGVPAQVSNLGASLSGASSAASGASNSSTNSVASNNAEKDATASLAQTALSWLDVFVTGLGEENCKPNDIECLKRQKTPSHP